VSDVLYMPKIEADNVELFMRTVDVRRCLDEVVATCRNLVTHNANEFIFEKSDDLGTIETDETRLRQILINLLSNAGKFTRNGTVILRAERIGATGELLLSIEDNGIGIPADALPALFENFNQVSSATAKSYGGSGLGLAVSHKLAQLLNGKITVTSEPGRGSTFTVRFAGGGAQLAHAA
jgi:signal transduction histidine kinase